MTLTNCCKCCGIISVEGTEIYQHKGNRNRYLFKMQVSLKDPYTDTWVDAVLYEYVENGHAYVRTRKNFYDRFELTPPSTGCKKCGLWICARCLSANPDKSFCKCSDDG